MAFSLMLLGAAGAARIFDYWLATLGGGNYDPMNSVAIDSSGNVYALGSTQSTGSGLNDSLLVKYDSAGTVQWQRVLGGAGHDYGLSVAIDSSDNVYVAGYTGSTGAGLNDSLLAKYDSSGTIQWQRTLGGASYDYGRAVAIDSADNVYVSGSTGSQAAGSYDFLLAKYNSAGTIQWQRILGGGGSDDSYDVAIDSSGNVYVFGKTQSTGAGGVDFLLAKYDSAGTVQWQRVLGGSSNDFGYGVAIDSSGNVYVTGYTGSTGAGLNDSLLVKYNSSGTVQWQRVLGGTGTEFGFAVAIDSADSVYVTGSTNSTGAGDADLLIAKYDSSGTIQWQRTLGGSNYDSTNSLAIDSSDNLYVNGSTLSAGVRYSDGLLCKLPNDGSLTGTYVLDNVNIVYAASSLTSATSTLTAATSSLTAATSSLTSATSTLTDASTSLTQYFVGIG